MYKRSPSLQQDKRQAEVEVNVTVGNRVLQLNKLRQFTLFLVTVSVILALNFTSISSVRKAKISAAVTACLAVSRVII